MAELEFTNQLLKEAIADAEAVRQTAIENAKLSLEETFTPQIKSMLERKLRAEVEHMADGEMEEATELPLEDGEPEGSSEMPADSSDIGAGDNKEPSDDAFASAEDDMSGEGHTDSTNDWYEDWTESDFDLDEVIKELEEDVKLLEGEDKEEDSQSEEDKDEEDEDEEESDAEAEGEEDEDEGEYPEGEPAGVEGDEPPADSSDIGEPGKAKFTLDELLSIMQEAGYTVDEGFMDTMRSAGRQVRDTAKGAGRLAGATLAAARGGDAKSAVRAFGSDMKTAYKSGAAVGSGADMKTEPGRQDIAHTGQRGSVGAGVKNVFRNLRRAGQGSGPDYAGITQDARSGQLKKDTDKEIERNKDPLAYRSYEPSESYTIDEFLGMMQEAGYDISEPAQPPMEETDLNLEEILAMLEAEDAGEPESEEMASEVQALQEELAEYRTAVGILRGKLHEVNLLNAKLLYTNKIFRKEGLSNDQKVRIVENFDRATTVREVKMVYSVLAESLVPQKEVKATKTAKKIVAEGLASKPVPSTAPKADTTEVIAENSVVKRLQQLAGIIS